MTTMVLAWTWRTNHLFEMSHMIFCATVCPVSSLEESAEEAEDEGVYLSAAAAHHLHHCADWWRRRHHVLPTAEWVPFTNTIHTFTSLCVGRTLCSCLNGWFTQNRFQSFPLISQWQTKQSIPALQATKLPIELVPHGRNQVLDVWRFCLSWTESGRNHSDAV